MLRASGDRGEDGERPRYGGDRLSDHTAVSYALRDLRPVGRDALVCSRPHLVVLTWITLRNSATEHQSSKSPGQSHCSIRHKPLTWGNVRPTTAEVSSRFLAEPLKSQVRGPKKHFQTTSRPFCSHE